MPQFYLPLFYSYSHQHTLYLKSPEPPRAVAWYRNGIRINALLKRGGISVVTESRRRTSNLLISKVTKEDAGNYTCAPSNAQADAVMVHVIEGMVKTSV